MTRRKRPRPLPPIPPSMIRVTREMMLRSPHARAGALDALRKDGALLLRTFIEQAAQGRIDRDVVQMVARAFGEILDGKATPAQALGLAPRRGRPPGAWSPAAYRREFALIVVQLDAGQSKTAAIAHVAAELNRDPRNLRKQWDRYEPFYRESTAMADWLALSPKGKVEELRRIGSIRPAPQGR